MDLISVIVPVYNVEEYLSKCIGSIIGQTYSELEIILVNDVSTDKSGNLCDEYSKKDRRIKVIHKKNGGLSDARNIGIREAKGKYISFIDSDDYIETHMYEIMFNALKKYNADIAVCGRWVENENEVKKLFTLDGYTQMDSKEALKCYLLRKKLDPSACDKLFKKELFSGVEFPPGKIHEDIFIMDEIISKSNRIVHVGIPLYHYVNRKGSITKRIFTVKNFDYIEALEKVILRNKNIKGIKMYAESFYFNGHISIIDKMLVCDIDLKVGEKILEYRKVIQKDFLKIVFNRKMTFKKKAKSLLISYFWPIYKSIYNHKF